MSCKSSLSRASSSCSAKNKKLRSIAAIVRAYEVSCRQKLDDHLEFYRHCDLETCLKLAPLGQTDTLNEKGLLRRYPHQTCIKTSSADIFRKILLKETRGLKPCRSFPEVLDIVARIAEKPECTGIGNLCIYDTAQRIGFHRGMEPEEIYLHAGVTDGARNLGINVKGVKCIPVNHPLIPKEFGAYNAMHLENILCIYKDSF